jgi:uridylate kinase
MSDVRYKRILLKFGGEALSGQEGFGIDPGRAADVAQVIKDVRDLGVEVALVIGAGNLWRGSVGTEHGMERSTADHMGMIATVMNALAMQDALERVGVTTRVQTAIAMNPVAEPYIRLRAIRHMEKGRVVIIAGGTSNPYFTTDSAGALRAMELGADVLIKATKVGAIYDSDPMKNPDAVPFKHISYLDFLSMQLRVMDTTAVSLCMENNLPIVVLDFWQPDSVKNLVLGRPVGTVISADADTVR